MCSRARCKAESASQRLGFVVCCRASQHDVACCSVLQRVAARRVTACYNVLQCAVCCSVLHCSVGAMRSRERVCQRGYVRHSRETSRRERVREEEEKGERKKIGTAKDIAGERVSTHARRDQNRMTKRQRGRARLLIEGEQARGGGTKRVRARVRACD